MVATVSMDSIQFYEPPFMSPFFSSKCAASPHTDPAPPVVPCHMKGSQALDSVGVIALDEWGDFGSQYNLGRDQDAVSEDDWPTLEELLRPTLHKEVLIEEPKEPEHALQRANEQSWTRLVDVGDKVQNLNITNFYTSPIAFSYSNISDSACYIELRLIPLSKF
jgi:hypothetical protein